MDTTTSVASALPEVTSQNLPTLAEKAFEWLSGHGPVILLVLALAIIFYKLLSISIRHAVSLISRNTFLTAEQAKQRAQTLGTVLDALARFIIFFIAGIAILQEANLPGVAAVIASASVLGVAVGFGAQSLVRDFISGFFILFENQFGVGDIIQIGSSKGTVEHLSLRTTQLCDFEGRIHTIPNSEIKVVVNESRGWSRAVVDIGILSTEDANKATEAINSGLALIKQSGEFDEFMLEEPQVTGIEAFKEDAMIIRVTAMVRSGLHDKLAREIRAVAQSKLREKGIAVTMKQPVG